MIETSFIRQYPNMINGDQCGILIDFFNRKLSDGSIAISNGNEDNGGGQNRVDQSMFLNRVDSVMSDIVNKVVIDCWNMYVDEFKFLETVPVISYACKMQKTPPMGGFHSWHWEHHASPENRNRMGVWTLYLTDHEGEGETEFLAHGLKVKPEKGKFCIFPADYTGIHRGNPVYSKDKYIVTGWYEYN